MILFYQISSILLSPFIDLYLFYRKLQKKEDLSRFNERLGYSTIKRPLGKLIWVHTASVGEANSVITLITSILDQYPEIHILITSGTVTSAREIAKKLPPRAIHQYIPVDKFFAIKRFIKHWQPNLAIFVESELWPNLIIQTKKSGCVVALANGRISDHSFRNWKILHKLGFNILRNFSICFAQSKIDQQKFIDLGVKNVQFIGNLKDAASPLAIDQNQLTGLRKAIGSRKLWLAASTHQGEEEIIINTHQQLTKHFPDLLTIIAPRHPKRCPEILELIPEEIKVAIRSQNQAIRNCEIYLADTMGELGTFYSLSPISLICGSLIADIGGHNPIEAIQMGSVILSGTFVENNQAIFDDLVKTGVCLMVKDQQELLAALLKLMTDQKYYQTLKNNISQTEHHDHNIINKMISTLSSLC